VKLARDLLGGVFLEVHADVMGGRRSELSTIIDQIEAAGLTDAVDVTRVAETVSRTWGIPEDVSRRPVGIVPASGG